jgi:hypothetical protein
LAGQAGCAHAGHAAAKDTKAHNERIAKRRFIHVLPAVPSAIARATALVHLYLGSEEPIKSLARALALICIKNRPPAV